MFIRLTIPIITTGILFLGLVALIIFFSTHGQADEGEDINRQHNTASVSEAEIIDSTKDQRKPATSTTVNIATSTSTAMPHVVSDTTKQNTIQSDAAELAEVHEGDLPDAAGYTDAAHTQTEPEPKLKSKSDPPWSDKKHSVSSKYETAVALEVHRLTNQKREEADLPALIYDVALAAIAKAHSAEMITLDYFGHVTPSGCDIACRLTRAGYGATAWAENIAWRTDSSLPSAQALAAHFFKNWMESKEHRVNLLSDVVTHEGVGVVRTGDTVYITVDFALK